MRFLFMSVATVGTLLLILFCFPRYGAWSLLVILPAGLFLLILIAKGIPVEAGNQRPVAEVPPVTARTPGSPVTTSEVLARITVALKAGGGDAATAEAEKLRHERIRCGDCEKTFVLNDGMIFGHPPAHRAPSAADREKLYGYTIECPACHKGGFAGKLI
jgi:hypothetical protein